MGLPERGDAQPAGGYRPNELAAASVALLLPLLFVTSFKLASWAPRYVALPLIAALGLTMTPDVLRGVLRRPAQLALGFALWAGLATLLAPNLTVAIWGRYSLGTGLVFLVALIGAWMLGGAVRPGAAALVERALWVAALINAAVALLQQVADLSAWGLGLYGGRSPGLYGNPVYLAELLAGALWLGLCRQRRWTIGNVAGLLVVSSALAVSGSRWAVGLAALAVCFSMANFGWRRGLAGALLVLTGMALGAGLSHAGINGNGTTGLDRAGAAPASGIRPRLDTWRSAVPAVGERPFVGWGPSGFLAATSPRRTLAVARTEGPDALFADAHNLVVELAVTTGIPGLALFVGWVALTFLRTRRADLDTPTAVALAGFAALTLSMTLAEPMHVGVMPVALLALGAAAAAGDTRPDAGDAPHAAIAGHAAVVVLVLMGVSTTAVLAVGLVQLRRAELSDNAAAARSAARLLPRWDEPASVIARLASFHGIADNNRAARAESLRWYAIAAHRDLEDPFVWNDWGGALLLAGDDNAAGAAFTHALRRNPWSLSALTGAAYVAARHGQPDRAAILRMRIALVKR